MAIVMKIFWQGLKTADYENNRRLVQWETNVPKGAISHVSWCTSDGINVLDVWESEGDFNRFTEERLLPVLRGQLKIQSDPKVEFHKVHSYFDPAALGKK